MRRDGTSYTAQGLECGSSVGVTVVAFDRAGNRSPQADAIVSTAACVDSEAPTVPRRMYQEATTQTAVVLAWDASTDNVGVVELRHLRKRSVC